MSQLKLIKDVHHYQKKIKIYKTINLKNDIYLNKYVSKICLK